MEIRAKGTLDLATCKIMFRITNKVRPAVLIGLYAALTVYFIVLSFLNTKNIPVAVVCVLFLTLLTALMLYAPKANYKQLGKGMDCVNEYVFYEDHFEARSNFEGYDGCAVITYGNIVKVIETQDHFFIYPSKAKAYPVEKATVEGGTVQQLGAVLLNAVGKNYKVSK